MILLKTLVPVFFILIGHCALSEDIQVNQQNVAKSKQQDYKFNHPPVLENYEPIPVAIVYNGDGIREEKLVDAKVNTDIQKTPPKELQSLDTSSTNITSKDATDVKPSQNTVSTVNSEQRLLKTRPFSVRELQIPVAVIYDEPIVIRTNKRNNKIHSTPERVVARPLRNRRPQRPNQQSRVETKTTKENHELKSNDNATVTESKSIILNSEVQETYTKKESDGGSGTVEDKVTSPYENIKITTYRPIQTTYTQKESINAKPSKVNDARNPTKRRERDPVVPIIESENHVYAHSGNYVYSYEGGDGTKAFQNGELKSVEDNKAGESVVGGFSYKDKDGKDFSLTYTADENGYQPVGAHLPTPPPIPPAIARALAYLATKPTPESEIVTESIKN